ncbi:MAG TPA: hydantoinase/oxoprolinase family protein [Rudaea sp.]|jgi:N-methylhydantoinase A/oxoprolinase/acetone carboxylase beta subunit|uniref:hydantoinase/oxoprolinase family protein n=1 Tax=Rudaea sp. TaxID=2136325 RepID=UPI002F92EBDA
MNLQPAPMKLINIDNGGTLTDICVIDGARVYRTKTVTTAYDLSKCLIDGLMKASRVIYGEDDLQRLLLSTDYIRYSTTQGTNALVERKGPNLGLILGGSLQAPALQTDAQSRSLFAALVGERVATLDVMVDETVLENSVTRAVTQLASSGASRIVIGVGNDAGGDIERRIKRILLRKFPQHLLGAVPILYSHEVVADGDDARRVWTALFNAFLHPAMERFLYNAEHKLREFKTRNPLLIFRNDGHSARVAKTIAVKTYSSGPRGGAEGSKALAAHYGFEHLLSMDVGGTTTDIIEVRDGAIRAQRHGKVENVTTSFALCDVESHGVGGSSIIRADNGVITVGPQSVGSAPGPACFGFGGTEATITDAFLVGGLLDPASYFGGELKIDAPRARAAVEERIAKPLGLSVEAAAAAMEQAWVGKIAGAMKNYTKISPQTTLAAFGGAGPFVVCKVAEATGITRVMIPGLAAVFSAFGIGFSDIAHEYSAPLATRDSAGLKAARSALIERARHGMFAEGSDLADCVLHYRLQGSDGDERALVANDDVLPADLKTGAELSLVLQAVKPIQHASISGDFKGSTQAATSTDKRALHIDGALSSVPVYRVEEQVAGASAAGPAVLEEAFFTCRIDAGWRFRINAAGDILLSHEERSA